MSDLWSNPMVKQALKSMSPEELENYRKIGEEMYGNINFAENQILNNLPPPMEEAVFYIKEGLKSGLHPRDMEENEIQLMVEAYGDKWYEKWDYTRDEVPEPGLSLTVKKELDKVVEQKIKHDEKKK